MLNKSLTNRRQRQTLGAVRLASKRSGVAWRPVLKVLAGGMLLTGGALLASTSIGRMQADETSTERVRTPGRTYTQFFFDDHSDVLDDIQASTDPMHATLPAPVLPAPVLPPPVKPRADAAISAETHGAKLMRTSLATPEGTRADAITANSSSAADTASARQMVAAPESPRVDDFQVRAGDTLSGILHRYGIGNAHLGRLMADELVQRHLAALKIGQRFRAETTHTGELIRLSASIGRDRRVTINNRTDGLEVSTVDLPVERERVVTSGVIEQSLFHAAAEAQLSQSTIMQLADIFQWELDFARDIRVGDQFALVYDRLYREGRFIGDGDILAAEFIRGGRTYQAIRFATADRPPAYYSPDGRSKRKTFLRHPVDVVRITSHFDPNRLHPVLHQIRAHRGVDYGSPYGSPIRATADGNIVFAGPKSTYGNTVILQHGNSISTLYAHMSKLAPSAATGARVSQGEIIGYVGNTGRVTGTHLHYEFRVRGTHVDPLTVELPDAAPLAPEYRNELSVKADEFLAQIRSVLPSANEQMASIGATADTRLD